MVSKRAAVPNRSEPGVPNGSERSKVIGAKASNDAIQASGRPPVLTDDQLDTLAIKLNDSLGRPPRLEELIAESGGCQRQRAGRAIQRLREGLAARAIKSTLVLPPAFEGELRLWIERMLSLSALQLASEHAQLVADHETGKQTAQDFIEEQQEAIRDLRERLADQQRITSELAAENRRLETVRAQAAADLMIARALADDRLLLLGKLAQPARSEPTLLGASAN